MIRFWGLMLWDGIVMGSSGSAGHCPFWYEGRENTNDRTLPHIQQGVQQGVLQPRGLRSTVWI